MEAHCVVSEDMSIMTESLSYLYILCMQAQAYIFQLTDVIFYLVKCATP